MKKVFFAVLLWVGAICAFANIEFDMNFSGIPFENLKNDDGTEYRPTFPFGLENQWSIFFGSPVRFLDLGMNVSYGADFILAGDQTFENFNVTEFDMKFGIQSFATLGAAVRFNIGEIHSITLSPGLTGVFDVIACREVKDIAFKFKDGSTETQSIPFTKVESGGYMSFSFDVGYKVWVLRRENYDFGFNCGYEFGLPLYGKFEDSSIKIGGTSHKVYLGVSFNFGQRKIKNPELMPEYEGDEWIE